MNKRRNGVELEEGPNADFRRSPKRSRLPNHRLDITETAPLSEYGRSSRVIGENPTSMLFLVKAAVKLSLEIELVALQALPFLFNLVAMNLVRSECAR